MVFIQTLQGNLGYRRSGGHHEILKLCPGAPKEAESLKALGGRGGPRTQGAQGHLEVLVNESLDRKVALSA